MRAIDFSKKQYDFAVRTFLGRYERAGAVAPDVHKNVSAHRKPTTYEIKFGHGATHYAEFELWEFLRLDGTLKTRIKGKDGLIYSRL